MARATWVYWIRVGLEKGNCMKWLVTSCLEWVKCGLRFSRTQPQNCKFHLGSD